MNLKGKLKVLPNMYANWLDLDFEMVTEWAIPVTPPVVFGRPGRYLLRGGPGHPEAIAWMELQDGKAYEDSPEMFLWEIKTQEASRLMPEEVEGLRAICKTRLATQEQRSLLGFWNHWMELRQISREATPGCKIPSGSIPTEVPEDWAIDIECPVCGSLPGQECSYPDPQYPGRGIETRLVHPERNQ